MNIPSWKTVSESLLDPISPSGLRENPQVSMAVKHWKAKQCSQYCALFSRWQ